MSVTREELLAAADAWRAENPLRSVDDEAMLQASEVMIKLADEVARLRPALQAATARAEAAEGDLARLADIAGEWLETDPLLRGAGCVEAALGYAATLGDELAGLRARLAEVEFERDNWKTGAQTMLAVSEAGNRSDALIEELDAEREADWLAYVKLLSAEVHDTYGPPYAHGWQGRTDEGKRLRERLGLDDNNDPKAALGAGEREG